MSIKRQVDPPKSINSSTASLVVPSASSTSTLEDPAKTFRRDDLPTLGLPTSATLRYPSSAGCEPTSGNCEINKSNKSPLPLPCKAETNRGSPSPKFQSA